ncbi:MAG: hypothetical protein NTU51_09250 [Bacteroidetes bacterium]|nr:hypothetical protein [Bacteroidota bacterium]
MSKNAIRAGLFGLGFISISTQIYLLRQGFIVFYGNELILGIMLSAWMLLTGAGAWLGRYYRRIKGQTRFVLFLMLLLSALPVLMLLKLNLYRALVLPIGALAGINDVVYATFLVLLPFCLINGFLFSALSHMLDDAGKAYSLESAGSMVSGAMVNFILLWLVPSWISMLIISGCYLITVTFFAFHIQGRYTGWFTLLISGGLIILLSNTGIHDISIRSMYPGQSIIEEKETPYGQLVITTNAGQLNFYENGLLMFSSGNEISDEENVHYAMIQRARPAKVLLVSGGLSGVIGEILKYHPILIDYIELNPALLHLTVRSLRNLEKKGVCLHQGDARRFIQGSYAAYDVVLVLLPPPYTLQLNRMYTFEFFKELKSRLSPDGIVAYSLPTTSDYVSQSGQVLNSILYNTLLKSFGNVMLVPGGKSYFIASDAVLNPDIPAMIEKKGIKTSYVNKYYLDVNQMRERAVYLQRNISSTAGMNYDFRPLMFFAQLNYWLSYFNRHNFASILVFLLIVVLVLLNLNPVNTGLFTGGFTAGAFQVLIILSMQICCGYVFQLTGFIIMLFMLGLALGSRVGEHWSTGNPLKIYISLQLLMAVLSVLIPFALIISGHTGFSLWVMECIAALATLLLSVVAGMEYSMSMRLSANQINKKVSENYSADLFGSALGAFIIPIFLFPLLGMIQAGYVMALMNTAGAALLFVWRKKIVYL